MHMGYIKYVNQAPLHTRKFSGSKLKSAREAMRISRNTLAAMVSVTSQTIYNWETDRFSPHADALFKIAAALDHPADWFYE